MPESNVSAYSEEMFQNRVKYYFSIKWSTILKTNEVIIKLKVK